MRRIGNVLLWGFIILVGVPTFGMIVNLALRSFIGGTGAPKVEARTLLAADPEPVSPAGEIADVLSLFSKSTDLQKDALKARLRGKVVEWTLPVYDVVKRSSGEVSIQTKSGREIGTFCRLGKVSDGEAAKLLAIRAGDRITCKGVISAFSFGHIELEPAILR